MIRNYEIDFCWRILLIQHMDNEQLANQYERMKAIVADLMEQPASQWDRLASERCGQDSALKAMVLNVLVGMEEETGHLDLPIQRALPQQIGSYRVLKVLGTGGMGVVYLAERADQFRQKIAVKCLRSELARTEDVTRFHMERQILAKLNHPHIAKILDGGITEYGLPYFVMEYVEGTPLTTYADAQGLGLKPRLQLFQQICQAVHYANQNLIVHRDLKPGNVLITADGNAKLLDFGIAKLLGHSDPYFSDLTKLETRTGMGLMTLQYASPEQYQGGPATIATDVYALGLLLYELLTGQPAYALRGLSHTEVADVIVSRLPEKPSRSLARQSDSASLTTLVKTHGVNAKTLAGRLQGDLDFIVMMALRKEPQRRYASVSELNQDIQAYLLGQPVAAHPDKWSYLLGKFVRRNRLLVGFSGLLLVSLLAISVMSVRFAQVTGEKNTQIAAERDQAKAISDFLVNLLKEADPLVQNTNPTMKEVLLRVKDQLSRETTIVASAKSRLNLTLIDVLLSYELHNQADALIREVLDSDAPPHDKRKAKSQNAVLFGNRGMFQKAWPLYDEVLASLQTDGDRESYLMLKLYKAVHLVDATRYTQGQATLEEILGEDLAHFPKIEIGALRNLGRCLGEMGFFVPANKAFDRAESRILEEFGPEAVALFDIRLNRIVTIAGNGDFATALEKADEAIGQMISVVGENHSLTCGAMAIKANCLFGLGRMEESLSLRRQALACSREVYGDSHHQVIFLLNEIGVNLSDLDRKDEAIETYHQAIVLAEKYLPPNHLFVSITHTNLGSALSQMGQAEEALHHNKLAYDAVKENPDLRNYFGACAFLYARTLQGLDQHNEAIPYFEEALAVAAEFPLQVHYLAGLVHYHLANSYAALEKPDMEITCLESAFADFLTNLGPQDSGTQAVFKKLQDKYTASNKQPELDSLKLRMQATQDGP